MTESPANEHDLRLPAWGPYTKRYIGVSHLADQRRGPRFDLSVFPGFYRRKVDVPNVLWESGYAPLEAAPDLRYFAHRHTLQGTPGNDEVYCDVAFAALDDDARLVCCTCVNEGDAPQTLALHWMASLHFPTLRANAPDLLYPAEAALPGGATWLDALDYVDLAYATPRPTDTLNPDGLRRGEVRGHGFTGGSGVGQGFGREAGDAITFRPALADSLADAALVLRYRLAPGQAVGLDLGGVATASLDLLGDGNFLTAIVPLGALAAGEQTLTLTSRGGAGIDLDGLALVPAAEAASLRFYPVRWQPQPDLLPGPHPRSLLLRYPDLDHWYGLAWDGRDDEVEVRVFHTGDLDGTLRVAVHHHTRHVFHGPGDGHFTNVFHRPVPLGPGEALARYGLVCAGSHDEVVARLQAFADGALDATAIHAAARDTRYRPQPSPGGEEFAASQERLATTLLTNVVYPIYARRGYIRHNTPGRWWDSLYTWDSGFIGLGLAELDIDRAADCLRAYLTPEGDPDAAFMHHGSPVPTQFALFHDLWNRTQSRELLEWCYPRLRQYHRFLAGRLGSSTTGALASGLLQSWDYFYNSGGWDDYPPQVQVHAQAERVPQTTVAPAITSSQVIRTAKILRHAAATLGLDADSAEYDADIARLGAALQRHAWDEESGYFGYVQHTKSGLPLDILRDREGGNANRGLDGAYPLVAGVCTPAQEERLLGHLFAPQELWTPLGLTAVDQSAPAYRADGYWNGTVWLAHQWYFWKALLDLGQPERARQIAQTALDLWRDEVARSGNSSEHFVVATGRGAGWHHFGGLSAPALQWFAAYHQPGRLTTGFDLWLDACAWEEDWGGLTATIARRGDERHRAAILATLRPGRVYLVRWDGATVEHTVEGNGLITILLPPGATSGTLTIATATRGNWDPNTGLTVNPWRETE